MAKASKVKYRSLQDAKVGDLLAPMRIEHRRGVKDRWTGSVRQVTKVTPKRVFMGSTQLDKVSGREVGGVSGSYYIIATPEMIAEFDWNRERVAKAEAEREAFRSREDYRHATAIAFLLSDITPDNHPLECMTPEEWRALRIKICGPLEGEG